MDMREYMMGLQAEERAKQRPKPQPMQVKVTTPVELAQQAARILEGTRQQPAIVGHEPPDIWRGFKTWTVSKAAWLALNIDPHLTEPTWKLCPEREQALKTLAQEMEHWLIDGVGDKSKATPKDLIHAMRALGLDHAWMTNDDPIHDDQPSKREEPSVFELLASALVRAFGRDCIEAVVTKERTSETGRVMAQLQTQGGCTLGDRAIRNYLKSDVFMRAFIKLKPRSESELSGKLP
jgi:hypothetical protein